MTIENNTYAEPSRHAQFVEAFLTEKPKDGIDVVQSRLRKGQKLTDELAEYFRERAAIEDQYARSLVKLSRKTFISDKTALGTMQPLWHKLFDEITDIANIHGNMAQNITDDVERHIRSIWANDKNLTAIRNMEPSMARYAKDYDELQVKLQKHQKVLEKAGGGKKQEEAQNKLKAYQQNLNDLKRRWSQEGPAYLEACQAIDVHRFNALKESIQAFEKMQAEQMSKRMEHADSVNVAALTLEVENELNDFTAHFSNLRKLLVELPTEPGLVEAVASDQPSTLSTPQPSFHEEPSVRSNDDAASIQTNVKNALKSLRRRTQAGVARSNVDGTTPDHLAEWATLDFNSGSGIDQQNDLEKSYNDSSLAQSFVSNGSINEKHAPAQSEAGTSAPAQLLTISKTPSLSESWSTLGMQTHKTQVDEEGYSIPPPDRTPWNEAAGATLNENETDDILDNSSIMSSNRIKVDIMNETVKEDAEASHALTRVATILKEKNTPSPGKRPRGRRETLRLNQMTNRSTSPQQFGGSSSSLDVSNFNKASISPVSADFSDTNLTVATAGANAGFISPQLNPFDPSGAAVDKAPVNPFELESRDTFSASPDSGQIGDADTKAPHLKADIAETVHVLTKAGEVVRSMITGEISLAYRGHAMDKPVCFRITNTEHIDRLVPNHTYISEVDGHFGVFRINEDMFFKAGGNSIVCLKYQLKMQDSNAAPVAPLIVKPIWKLEDNMSMLLIKYNGSTEGLTTDKDIVLENMSFLVPVDGRVTSAQSMPACVWSMERQKLLWNLGDLTIAAGETPEEKKLMAKFDTQSKGTPQAIAIKFTSSSSSITNITLAQDVESEGEFYWAHVESVQRRTTSGKYLAEP
ncbi:hypothetical protein INT43_002677 [Umbelopsis isabellina]|uniref:MHD domain-containing protein n=1 Tax=Mortierella isabellina TaxID=91625 RepID=A0A8H7Q4A2_MORIS|nr:hypothetical protein INT43_002677 [Umbelopsis isabellina]